MKKKITAALLIAALTISAASCAGADSGKSGATEAPSTSPASASSAAGTSAGTSAAGSATASAAGSSGTSASAPATTEAPTTTAAMATAAAEATALTTRPYSEKSDGGAGLADMAADRDGDDVGMAAFSPEAEPVMAAYEMEYSADAYELSFMADDYTMGDEYKCIEWYPEYIEFYPQARAGLLTGGEWRDNSNFAFWNSLFGQREDWSELPGRWNVNTVNRVFVRVTGNGSPAAGLTVKLAADNTLIWEAVTDSRGEAFLFANIGNNGYNAPTKIIVETAGGQTVTADVPKDYLSSGDPIEINISEAAPMRKKLDLMFMIDTTGSMGDELRYLQTELASVIDTVTNTTDADTMLSVNFYRDEGDEYVIRDFDFTQDISSALDHLADQRADGGGDYPEAVIKALRNGISEHQWRSDSEKLMFLVLDAPPHEQDAASQLAGLILEAARKGIRIIPVASSGVDTDTEFLCRSMAIATGGTYTFLTDDSGIGGSHLEPTIGDYTVEKLNDMLVRIIADYFSQEPRSYNTQAPKPQDPPQTQQPQTQPIPEDSYPVVYFSSSDYFDGEGMYVSGLITNERELEKFTRTYGFDRNDEECDFSKKCMAYSVVLLSSGSITVSENPEPYVTLKDGNPIFHYELNYPEVGTCDIKTLFMFAEIPTSALQ